MRRLCVRERKWSFRATDRPPAQPAQNSNPPPPNPIQSGEASDKYMVVFASNQPEQFDWAINDRIDEMVDFNLPGAWIFLLMRLTDTEGVGLCVCFACRSHPLLTRHRTRHQPTTGEEERLEMVTMYLEKYVLNPPSAKAKPITVSGIGEEEVKYAAKATVGFSGREISKLAIAWQAAAYGASGEAVLDKELYLRVLDQHLGAKRRKAGWQEAAMQTLAETRKQIVIDSPPPPPSASSK